MSITDIAEISRHGRDKGGEGGYGQGCHRRISTISGSVLLAGAISLCPAFIAPAFASSPPTSETGAVQESAQTSYPNGSSNACPPADAWHTWQDPICQGFEERKNICKAWEDQLNTQPGWKLNNCRFMP
jgi:hypothetical protein